MSGTLSIQNRQRAVPVNTRQLRKLVMFLLKEDANFDLAIYLVGSREMARINETHLQHEGPTDVITFDYGEVKNGRLHGEIFVCTDEAISQAKQFRTGWQSEVVRYIIHGILHLRGFDDCKASDRRRMKRDENRLLRSVTGCFPSSELATARRP